MIYNEFLGTVSVEIEGRIPKITSQVLADWHHECQYLNAVDAVEKVREFFRQYEGKHLPKPGEFGHWLRGVTKRQVLSEKRRFNFHVKTTPGRTAIRLRRHGEDGEDVYDGYAQRFRDCDVGHIDVHFVDGRQEQCGVRPEFLAEHNVTAELAPDIDPWTFDGSPGPSKDKKFKPTVLRESVVGGDVPF